MPLGRLRNGAGTCQPAKGTQHRLVSRRGEALREEAVVFQLRFRHWLKFFSIIGRIQLRVVNRFLADDGVEEMASCRHAAAGGD
jgi:hypothetical protein